MADDNAMNLRNRVVPRNFGNDQASSFDNAGERQATLPAEGEASGPSDQQEPSLAQALGQITWVLQVLDQNSHRSTARLDAVLAAITTFNENIARIGHLLTRNEQPIVGLQGPMVTPVLQNLVTPVNMADIKGKVSAYRKTNDGIAHTKRTLRLCIRCKAEMTKKDWEAIIHEKKLYGEWREFMAFPEEWEDIPEAENKSEEGSEETSNESKQEVDSVKGKKDLLIPKVESIEYEEAIYEEDELTVAILQLEDAKAVDSVVFKKLSTMQTRFVRLLFIRALIEDSHYNLLLRHDWIHTNECVPSTLHGKLFQWIGDKVEKIRAEGRPQMVDINSEGISHINWAETNLDQISFIRVTDEGVQLILMKDEEAMVASKEPPSWLKWNAKSQEPKL
uniref:Uncharacterized protein n=1 Tax=Ananas comosus var. bracteatus TaxID=296719 RepID=A0A6V7NP19_ANACO|nr:unnamed protein product [Ananas comosus var. bracteatus]